MSLGKDWTLAQVHAKQLVLLQHRKPVWYRWTTERRDKATTVNASKKKEPNQSPARRRWKRTRDNGVEEEEILRAGRCFELPPSGRDSSCVKCSIFARKRASLQSPQPPMENGRARVLAKTNCVVAGVPPPPAGGHGWFHNLVFLFDVVFF